MHFGLESASGNNPPSADLTSLAGFVSKLQKVLEEEGTFFQLTDMETIVEGEAEQLFPLAGKLHEILFCDGVQRVLTKIAIDDRCDKNISLGDKVASVKKKL